MSTAERSLHGHPGLAKLGRTGREQLQVEAFAEDLSAWLAGASPDDLGAMARVLVKVAGAELAPVRDLCHGREDLAVEAAVRAAGELWRAMQEWAPIVRHDTDPSSAPSEVGDGQRVAGAPGESLDGVVDAMSERGFEASARDGGGAAWPRPGEPSDESASGEGISRAAHRAAAWDLEHGSDASDRREGASDETGGEGSDDEGTGVAVGDGAAVSGGAGVDAESGVAGGDGAAVSGAADVSAGAGAEGDDSADRSAGGARLNGADASTGHNGGMRGDGVDVGGADAATRHEGEMRGAGAEGDDSADRSAGGARLNGADASTGHNGGMRGDGPDLIDGADATVARPGAAGAPDAAPARDAPSSTTSLGIARSGSLPEGAGAPEQRLAAVCAAHPDALARAVGQAEAGALASVALNSALVRLLPGMGWSLGPGALRRAVLRDLSRLSRLLARLPSLIELADALGRAEAASARAGPAYGGGEEVVGVAPSGDVARALPGELALLSDAGTEDLFYARWAEHRLISLELAGAGLDGRSDEDHRGPVLACLDASASMDGDPELTAKGLLLALCRRVLRQRREVVVLVFGGRGERLERRLRRGLSAVEGLLDLLAFTFDGGTDFDGPLLRALELLEERDLRRADVLVITDGHAIASAGVVRAVEKARERFGVRVSSVVIGSRWDEGVAPFSDTVWHLRARPGASVRRVVDGLSDL